MNFANKILEESKAIFEMKKVKNWRFGEVENQRSIIPSAKYYRKFCDLSNGVSLYIENDYYENDGASRGHDLKNIHQYTICVNDKYAGEITLNDFKFKNTKIKGVHVVGLKPKYRGKGYIYIVYDYLINKYGMLASGDELTEDGHKTWENLMKTYPVYLYFANTQKIIKAKTPSDLTYRCSYYIAKKV